MLEVRKAYFIRCGGARDPRTGKPVASFERFGSGLRLIYVQYVGRKWLKLIDPTTLDRATLRVTEWEGLKPAPADTKRSLSIMRRIARRNKRIGMPVPPVVRRELRGKTT